MERNCRRKNVLGDYSNRDCDTDLGIDKSTGETKYRHLIYEGAGTAKQLGKELFSISGLKQLATLMEKLKSDPYLNTKLKSNF